MAQTQEGALKTRAANAGLTVAQFRRRLKAGMKRCTRCKQWKLTKMFGRDRTREDGLDATCLDCRHVKIRKSTKGRVSTFKGHHHTEEAKRKMSKAHKGQPSPQKGSIKTTEERARISAALRQSPLVRRGAACHSYRDGRLAERRGQRFSRDYKRWRFDVFARDHFTCQDCGDARGGNLIAHHLKPFSRFPRLRLAIGNGITLCRSCHSHRHP